MVKWSFPGSLYFENMRKNFKSILELVVVLVLESKGLYHPKIYSKCNIFYYQDLSLFHSIILHILHKLFDKVDGFCIMQFSQSNSKVFWVVYLKGFMSSSLKLHDSNSTTYFSNLISSILWIIIKLYFFTSKFFFSCNRWCLAQLWDTSLFFWISIILS